jgi:hypothetical protein
MQMFKRSFVNKHISVNLNNKKQIISNLIPWKIVISKYNNNKNGYNDNVMIILNILKLILDT